MPVAYVGARLVGAVSDHAVEDGAVVVEDGRIVSVGSVRDLPAGVEVVDLGNSTLRPGLIGSHVHLVWSGSAEPHEVVVRESRPHRPALREQRLPAPTRWRHYCPGRRGNGTAFL